MYLDETFTDVSPRECLKENIQMTILGQTKGLSCLISHSQPHHEQVLGMREGGFAWYIFWILSHTQHISISNNFLIYMRFSIFINSLIHGVPGVHGYMEFSSMCLWHRGKFQLPLHPLAVSDTSVKLPASRTFLFALNPELQNNPPIISDRPIWKKKKKIYI